jgi:hypothetical protein
VEGETCRVRASPESPTPAATTPEDHGTRALPGSPRKSNLDAKFSIVRLPAVVRRLWRMADDAQQLDLRRILALADQASRRYSETAELLTKALLSQRRLQWYE